MSPRKASTPSRSSRSAASAADAEASAAAARWRASELIDDAELNADGLADVLGPNAHNKVMRLCSCDRGVVESMFVEVGDLADGATYAALAAARLGDGDLAAASACAHALLGRGDLRASARLIGPVLRSCCDEHATELCDALWNEWRAQRAVHAVHPEQRNGRRWSA